MDFIPTLVKFLPTIIVVLVILLCSIRGVIRGFRKSFILFLNYIISLAIGIGIFSYLAKNIYTMDINFIIKPLNGILMSYTKVDLSNAHTINDAIGIYLQSFEGLESYAEIAQNADFQQALISLVGCVVNLILGLVCLVLIPFLVRIILYIFYFIFFSEGRHKRRVIEEEGSYKSHRFFGLGIGILRGVIASLLCVSLLSSVYFIVAGGIYTEAGEEPEKSPILDSLGLSIGGVDASEIYTAIKESRNSGVGLVLDKIKYKGEPIDYLFSDLFLSSNFKTSLLDENGIQQTKNLNLRKELAFLVSLAQEVIEKEAVKIDTSSGSASFEIVEENLDALDNILGEYCEKSVLISDVIPTAVIGLCNAIRGDEISLKTNIKEYLSDDAMEQIKSIDFASDLKNIISAALKLLPLVPLNSNGTLDQSNLTNLSYYFNEDNIDMFKEFFNKLSDVKLITKVAAPIGSSIWLEYNEQQLKNQGIDSSDIDLKSIDWKAEVANCGNIYEKIVYLNLNYKIIMGEELYESSSSNPKDSAFSSNFSSEDYNNSIMNYVKALLKDDAFKENFLNLVDTIFDSSVLSQVTLVVGKASLAKVKIGEESIVDIIGKDSLSKENYGKAELKEDIRNLISSGFELSSLMDLLQNYDKNSPLNSVNDIDLDSIDKVLFGKLNSETGKVENGIYNLKLLGGKADAVVDKLVRNYGKDFLTDDDLNNITSWKDEIKAVLGSLKEVQNISKEHPEILDINYSGKIEEILTNFPRIDDSEIDSLTGALSKSKLLNGLLKGMLTETLNSVEVISVPEGVTWIDSDSNKGELNSLLKTFRIFKDKGITNFDDTNKIINCLAELSDEEIDTISKSDIIISSLDQIVSDQLTNYEVTLTDINWRDYEEDGVKKQGELKALIKVLSIDALKTENEVGEMVFDFNNLNENTIKKLSYKPTGEEKCDVDILTDSKVIIAIIDKVVEDALADISTDMTVPEGIEWANSYDSEGNLVKQGELANIVEILNSPCVNTIDSEGNSNLDLNKLSDIDNLAQIIRKNEDDSLNYDDAIAMASSKIIMNAISGKLKEIGDESSSVKIIVPESIDADKMAQTDGDYKKGEFVKVLYVLYSAREKVISSEVLKLTTDNLISGVVRLDDHSIVIDSKILYATISNYIVEYTSGDSPEIKMRDEAKVEDLIANDNIAIKSSEIVCVLDTLRELELEDFNNVKISSILDKISATDDTTRELICKSNILNITAVDKIVNASSDSLTLPTGYDTCDSALWYPANDATWSLCELNLLLLSVAELQQPDESGNKGISVDSNDSLNIDVNVMLFSLNNDSTSDSSKSRIEVIYESKVIASTITSKVNEYKDDGTILIRDCAYVDSNPNNNLNRLELKQLIDVLEDFGITKIEDVKTKAILDNIAEENKRKELCYSNILNITAVKKILESDELTIPTELSAFASEGWYPASDATWKDCELNKLLLGVSELDLSTNTSDEIEIDNEGILNSLSETANSDSSLKKIDVVYSSDVIAATISNYILTNNQIDVPKEYKANSSSSPETIINNNIISKTEIGRLVDAIHILNLTFDSSDRTKTQASELTADDITSLTEEEITSLTSSAIISLKVSSVLPTTCCVTPSSTVFTVKDKDSQDFSYDGVYSSEIANLLIAVKLMEFKVNDSDTTFALNTINIADLRESLNNSQIFRATMSKQITDNVALVPYTYHKSEEESSRIDVMTKLGDVYYLTSDEISNMILVLQELGMTDSSNTSQIDSEFLSSLDRTAYPTLTTDIANSAIITTLITTKIDGCSVPDSNLVHYEEQLFKTNESNSIEIINATEMNALLTGILDLGITYIANTSSISISELNITDFETDITNSYILRATISDKITDSVTNIPAKDFNGNKIYSSIGEKEYLIASEISSLVKAFKNMNLDFNNISSIDGVEINKVNENIVDLLKSAIIHKELSQSVIDQNVVTTTYYKDSSNIIEVTRTVEGTTYINKDELEYAINGLNALGVNAEDAGSIDQSYLSSMNDSDVDLIKVSAILSKIFSKILIDNKVPVLNIPYYQAIGAKMTPPTIFSTHNVYDAKGNLTVEILSEADIETILENRNVI